MAVKRTWGIVFAYLLVIFCFSVVVFCLDRGITAASQGADVPRSRCIVIDPGHGGEDGGAISCSGALESHINLSIALRTRDLLQLMGMETYLMRETDCSVYTSGKTLSEKKISDLKERVRRIESTENAVVISIHQNTYPQSNCKGAQVFYAESEGSRQLAADLQLALNENLHSGNRKIKEGSGIYLLQHISCPGVLVECGFLSNPQEESTLRSDVYQKKLAGVLACVCSNSPIGIGNLA